MDDKILKKNFKIMRDGFNYMHKEFKKVDVRLSAHDFEFICIRNEMKEGFKKLDDKFDWVITRLDGLAKNHEDHKLELSALYNRQNRFEVQLERLKPSRA